MAPPLLHLRPCGRVSHHVEYLLIGGYAVGYEVEVNLISLDHLKVNKKASGRYKDLDDLENLS